MKKPFALLCIGLLVFSLFGCSGAPGDVQPTAPGNGGAAKGEEIEHISEVYPLGMCNVDLFYEGCANLQMMSISSVQHLPIFVCDTKAEFDRFVDGHENALNLTESHGEFASFVDATAHMNDIFFDHNTVLFVFAAAPGEDETYLVDHVYYDGASLSVCVVPDADGYKAPALHDVTNGEDGNGALTWVGIVTVKDEHAKTVTTFDAYLDRSAK